jgi:hypothetical protein
MSGKFIIVPLAAALIAAGSALAQQVGTATAVNPVSESTPPGGTTDKLAVGARVMHNERIHTSSSGSAQLLFLDKSSVSIAPNTSLVIDEFVYDPAANRGHMLTRLTQGTLQYIGGQPRRRGRRLSEARFCSHLRMTEAALVRAQDVHCETALLRRHCERSEAIQSVAPLWIAPSLTLLAMT